MVFLDMTKDKTLLIISAHAKDCGTIIFIHMQHNNWVNNSIFFTFIWHSPSIHLKT